MRSPHAYGTGAVDVCAWKRRGLRIFPVTVAMSFTTDANLYYVYAHGSLSHQVGLGLPTVCMVMSAMDQEPSFRGMDVSIGDS